MANSIANKLKISPGQRLLTLHAPSGFRKDLGVLPAGVKISGKDQNYDQVHWFVINRAQLEDDLAKLMKLLKPGITIWAYYPKGSSKVQTDLSRDKGWDRLLAHADKLTWISLVSFNETWSVFGFRARTEADKKKEAKPKEEREIFKWINADTKSIRLPADLAAALNKNKKAAALFKTLSFTNKKEYLEWVVSAKRLETREERIRGTIERLGKSWKNPRNI